ncbi:distal tail protein Dit [Vagococcus elongatus]|uniref:distal tail protein Dit n=1 Tax=Vagococcus elongatus TaxID=180344 RepID=UPI0014770B95|nr:distal tail protein Dit [Vagococcus elongatus]
MSDFKVWFGELEITKYLQVTNLDRGIGMTVEPDLQKVGNAAGKKFQQVQFHEKTIPMGFVLRYDLIAKRRELAKLLIVSEPKPLIFSDEPDKYYLAVPTGDINVAEKSFLGFGDIEWVIPDGLAHSIDETELVLPNDTDIVEINYEGSAPIPVSFEFKHSTENGFLGIADSNDNAVQVGNALEVDGVDVNASERLLYDDFLPPTRNKWRDNNGFIRYAEHVSAVQNGVLRFGTDANGRTRTITDSFGDTATHDGWTGPSIYRELDVDTNGSKTAKDWWMRAYTHFYAHNNVRGTQELGFQEINITDAEGNFLAGILWWKRAKGTVRSTCEFWVKQQLVWRENSDRWNDFIGQTIIEKRGDTFTFAMDKLERGSKNTSQRFTYRDPSLAEVEAAGVTYWNGAWKTDYPTDMAIYELELKKHNVEYWQDIPNMFSPGDKVNVACTDRKVETYVNDGLNVDIQEMASKPIMLVPGKNEIGIAYSDFSARPEMKLTYRERWL